jgi:hypothetical protein
LIGASAIAVAAVKPYTAALTGDGYQFAYYLILFAGGYIIGARHHTVLNWTARNAWMLLAMAIALFLTKSTLLSLALIADRQSVGSRRLGTTWFGTAELNHIFGDRSSDRMGMVYRRSRLGRKIFKQAESPAGRA